MLFINTRPADRAQALTKCLEQAHYPVMELSVLELKERRLDSALKQLYSELANVDVIVVVSPTAAHVGMKYLHQCNIHVDQLQHVQWVAVGQTTAKALAEYGIQSMTPEVESSEGMLSLDIFDTFQSLKKIAFWRGEGGRQFMMQQCAEQQAEVLNFVLYERYCPSKSTQKFQMLLEKIATTPAPYWVCISSEASWKNWLQLSHKHPDLIQRCHYLVLGERLYQLLNDDKNKLNLNYSLTRLSSLNPEVVLQQMIQLQRKI